MNNSIVSQTQKIIVNPHTQSVAVINAGPMGPAGPTGEVSLAQFNEALALKASTTQLTDGLALKVAKTGDSVNGILTVLNNGPSVILQNPSHATEGGEIRFDGRPGYDTWTVDTVAGRFRIFKNNIPYIEILDNGDVRLGGNTRYVTFDESHTQLEDQNYRQFIRGFAESSGSTQIPVFIGGSVQDTTNASGDLSIAFGETFGSVPVIIAAPSHDTGATSSFSSCFTHVKTTTGFSVRCYNHTGALLASTLVNVQWMALGRRSGV